jgi:hypothetical protein
MSQELSRFDKFKKSIADLKAEYPEQSFGVVNNFIENYEAMGNEADEQLRQKQRRDREHRNSKRGN